MSDDSRQPTNDAIDKQGEEETELTGEPMDEKSTPRKVGQTPIPSNDDADSTRTRKEHDRQLETGEKRPS